MNHHRTFLTWTMAIFSYGLIFLVINIKLLGNNLYCKKCYINMFYWKWKNRVVLIKFLLVLGVFEFFFRSFQFNLL